MQSYNALVLDIKSLRLPLRALNKAFESQEYTDIILAAKILSQKITEILNELDMDDEK